MKLNKILSITLTSLMYLSMVLVYIPVINLLVNDNVTISNNPLNLLFIFAIALVVINVILSITLVISSFINMKKMMDMSKITMIIKLVSIPWFIANYVLWFFAIVGMLNPILFLAIPIVLILTVSITYLFMISVSLNNLLPIFVMIKNKEVKKTPLLILGIIFHFIFCLDILGSIFIYKALKKKD